MNRLRIINIVLLSISAVGAEIRTWTADDGKTVSAEFVSRSMNSVRLKAPNGKMLNVPMARLSEVDRIYVELNSPPTLQVEIDPNKNTISESALNRRDEGCTLLDFELSVRKTSRLSYSQPLHLNLYVIGVQEVSGHYVIIQHISQRVRFDEETNKKSIKAEQVVLTHTLEQKADESEYEGYVLTVTDELESVLVVQSNRKAFERHASVFNGAQAGTLFLTDPLMRVE